ncbi:MAG TPA: ABC transporter substrate-binding protein [Acidimicrobiales bacterium]|nr:ABC transporter substrate-binding protein [Acidimicrobiales bacterium]
MRPRTMVPVPFGSAACRAAGAVVALGTVAGVFGLPAAPAGASPAPIKIAMVTSATGVAGPEFNHSQQGFLARIDLQNAQGGVNGHKLVPIVLDDQGSLTTAQTAVQDAVSQGAFGVVSVTPFMFAAYKYLQQNGIPVTGGFFDGPEWGIQPNTNMFSSDAGSVDPTYPANSGAGIFYREHGGTTIATYGYGISPSSTHSAQGTAESAKHAGLKVALVDTSIPFGGVDFTDQALTAKADHVDTLYASLQNNSNYALITAMHQAGVHLKVVNFPTGIEPDVITSPAWKDLQGSYFTAVFHPTQIPTAATRAFQAALAKYQGRTYADFPTYDVYEGWLGADLFIKGLEVAGKNPTRQAFIANLRKVNGYTGGGLLNQPINYSTIFGHDLPEACYYFLQVQKTGFVATSTKPVCGHDIPGTATASGG